MVSSMGLVLRLAEHPVSLTLSVSISVYLSSLSLSLSVSFSLCPCFSCLSFSFYLSVYVSVCLSLSLHPFLASLVSFSFVHLLPPVQLLLIIHVYFHYW